MLNTSINFFTSKPASHTICVILKNAHMTVDNPFFLSLRRQVSEVTLILIYGGVKNA